RRGRVDLEKLLRRLGQQGLIHLLVEGGSEVNTAFLRAHLADELVLFVAPKLIGSDGIPWVRGLSVPSMARALRLSHLSAERCAGRSGGGRVVGGGWGGNSGINSRRCLRGWSKTWAPSSGWCPAKPRICGSLPRCHPKTCSPVGRSRWTELA